MRRLVTDNHPFGRCIVTTMTADVARELGRTLGSGEVAATTELIRGLTASLLVTTGPAASVEVNLRRQPEFTVRLSDPIASKLGCALERVVDGRPNTPIRLSEVDSSLSAETSFDWVIRVQSGSADLIQDYVPYGLGAMWEAVLFVDRSAPAANVECWREIRAWGTAGESQSDTLTVHGEAESWELPGASAFAYLEAHRDAWLIGYGDVPFRMAYGESHDWVQVWFRSDSIQVIVHDRHCATGCTSWDYDNFFLFRDLLLRLAQHSKARAVAWGIEVDALPKEAAFPIQALTNLESLGEMFSALPHPHTEAATLSAHLERWTIHRDVATPD